MAQPHDSQLTRVKTGGKPDPSRESPKLPHERDQDVEKPQPPRPDIRQAQDDIESGQQDTDLRGTPGLDKPGP